MIEISDPELQKEFIIHELEEQRAIWLGSTVIELVEQSYKKMDSLLDEFNSVVVQVDGNQH